MIKRSPAHMTADGKLWPTLDEAQVHEIELMLNNNALNTDATPIVADELGETMKRIAAWIIEHKEEVLDVLTTKRNSRPGGRAIHGGTKNIRTKAQIAADKKAAAVNAALQDAKQ